MAGDRHCAGDLSPDAGVRLHNQSGRRCRLPRSDRPAGAGRAAGADRRGGEISALDPARTSVVEGKSVSVRVDLGGRRLLKTQKYTKLHNIHNLEVKTDIEN